MIIELKGEYFIQRAPELQSLLIEHLGSSEPLELDLSKVTEADYSFFQLIHSALKTSGLVTIVPEQSESIRKQMDLMNLP